MASAPSGPVVPYESRSVPNAPHFKRTIGAVGATAINMTQMCGIGPFVTIPLIVGAMGGPQAIFAFLIGALIAMADGLVWAELGAAMPGAGGTYLYLREAFQYSTGKLMPFLFVWTAMISIPLIMSTGVIGLVQYLKYYWPALKKVAPAAGTPGSIWDYFAVTPAGAFVSLGIVILVVVALYRRVGAIEKLTAFFFIMMLAAVGAVALACYSHFHPELAFTFPGNAFEWPWGSHPAGQTGAGPSTAPVRGIFFLGLGFGLTNAVYDYAGYNTAAYMGAELRDPGRTIPRSIFFSIFGMMAIYLTLQIGVLGVLPWQDIAASESIGSLVLEHTWGKTAAQIFTAFIVITAFASLVMGLLGGSRVPFNAAKDGLFLPVFGRLHPRLNFPHIALLVMAAIMGIGSLFSLGNVIVMLTVVMVPVQAVAQIAALVILRRRQPGLKRPYRMVLYPLPAAIALAGWLFVYYSSGWTFDPTVTPTAKDYLLAPGSLSVYWLIAGIICFCLWARVERIWPFGPKQIREEFLSEERAGIDPSR
jgi:amino acid transporter